MTHELLQQAIHEQKSMDLDVCVDEHGKPYLGHSKEYHEKSGDPWFQSIPLSDAVDRIVNSNIVVMVDCKHYDAWPVIEQVVSAVGPERCLVGGFVSEFRFGQSRGDAEPDFRTKWSPIALLKELKRKYPAVTTTAGAKWTPPDLLSDRYESLVAFVREMLYEHQVDIVGFMPEPIVTNEWLRYFLERDILLQIGIDSNDRSSLKELFVGETDHLAMTSKINEIGQPYA